MIKIRIAEYRAIYGDPTLGTRYGYRALPSIHIIVENGHVTLEGVVANQFDKNLINVRSNGVPNVSLGHQQLSDRTPDVALAFRNNGQIPCKDIQDIAPLVAAAAHNCIACHIPSRGGKLEEIAASPYFCHECLSFA